MDVSGLTLVEAYRNGLKIFNARLSKEAPYFSHAVGGISPGETYSWLEHNDTNKQSWLLDNTNPKERNYTSLFIDIYDNYSQKDYFTYIFPLVFAQHPSLIKLNLALLGLRPDDVICIPDLHVITQMAFNSTNIAGVKHWLEFRASLYHYRISEDAITRFFEVYSQINPESFATNP